MSETLPRVAQKGPYRLEPEQEKLYSWCTCGKSEKQPFCDGSHKGTAFKSLKFQAESPGEVWLCGCKHTKTPPYCDGSHAHLPE